MTHFDLPLVTSDYIIAVYLCCRTFCEEMHVSAVSYLKDSPGGLLDYSGSLLSTFLNAGSSSTYKTVYVADSNYGSSGGSNKLSGSGFIAWYSLYFINRIKFICGAALQIY